MTARRSRRWLGAGALWLCAAALPAGAEELPPLPDPLSLEDALAYTRSDLPTIELAQAQRDASAAALAEAEALSGLRVSAEGVLRVIDPAPRSLNRDTNDSRARLALRKRLYDFGYSESREEAARLAGRGSEWRHLDALQQARLTVMQAFFDVILADLQFTRDNEAMAGAFIDADRARDRHELGRLSDVDLLAFETGYREALQLRNESQALQRLARSRLAIAMGRPGDLVANVLQPPRPDMSAPAPDFDTLLGTVLQDNPELQALRADLEAARAELQAARNTYGPVLSGEVEAAAYNRETNTTHPFGASLILELPLFSGGADAAAVGAAQARLRASRARLGALENALREQVLELWLRLNTLRVAAEGLDVRDEYRALYLDRSRVLYDLEVKADLGDAMTETSAVRLDLARVAFDWIMTNAQLRALSGQLLNEEHEP